jgi:hypothetical protein
LAVDPIRRVEPRRDVAPPERVQYTPVEREQRRREREERRRKRRDPRSAPAPDGGREGLDVRG